MNAEFEMTDTGPTQEDIEAIRRRIIPIVTRGDAAAQKDLLVGLVHDHPSRRAGQHPAGLQDPQRDSHRAQAACAGNGSESVRFASRGEPDQSSAGLRCSPARLLLA